MFLGSFLLSDMSLDPTPINSGNTESVMIENGVFGDIYISNDISHSFELDIPNWDYTTILHAKFQNNLLAGNVDFSIGAISSLLVKKRVKDTYSWIKIMEIPINGSDDLNFFYNDYIVASRTKYEYAAVPILYGSEGSYQVISVDVEFDGAYILDTTNSYHLVLNLSKGSLTRPIPSSILEPVNSRYPYVNYYSQQNYDKFSINGLFVNYNKNNCEFDFDNGWKFRKEVRDFLNNKYTKIVKFYNGEIFMTSVIDSITETADGHPDNVNTTLNLVEVGDVNNVSDLYYHGFTKYLEAGV